MYDLVAHDPDEDPETDPEAEPQRGPDAPQKKDGSEGGRMRDRIEASALKSRRILLSGAFDNDMANEVIRKLWYLEEIGPGKPILLVINSPGGSVDSGFAIWDQIKMISSPVTTLVTGLAASMGSVLSLVAEKGRRFSTPNARIMIHQPLISGRMMGPATDLDIEAQEILKTRDALVKLYAEATGKSLKVIEDIIDRNKWMSAEEAMKFGLLDKVITSYRELDACH